MDWRGTRILIGASSFTDAAAALRIAGRLAENMVGNLGGLLIEENDVVATCSIPNQRVISASGAVIIAPSPAQVQTLINADAHAFRKLLAEIARPPSADWTFEQQTGDLIECAITVGKAWDVLIVGHRDIHPVPGAVVLLGSLSSVEDKAFNLSTTLASQLKTELLIFSVGGVNVIRPQIRLFHFTSLDVAMSQLTRTNAQVVVIDLTRGPIHSKDQLRNLLDSARCPVVVLGTSSLEPVIEYSTHIPPAPVLSE